MILYLIRHAQSRNNALWLATNSHVHRSPDPLLSDVGVEQARYLAEYLSTAVEPEGTAWDGERDQPGFGITHVYCSLMLRAVETGLAVARKSGVTCNGWVDIHETGGIVSGDGVVVPYQAQPGSTAGYLREHYPDLVFAGDFGETGWWNRPREEEMDRRPRAKRVVKALLKQHAHTRDRVVMITHGSFYNHLMREMLGLKGTGLVFHLSNTAITRWDITPHPEDAKRLRKGLVYSNRVDHLPKELVTI